MNFPFLDFPSEIDAVKNYMLESVETGGNLLGEVAEYMNIAGGKMLRPRLLILVGRSVGEVNERTLRVAAAIELIHTATLLHDDVIDKASLRRGRPSVNAKYGDDVAILMADLLFSKAFDLALYAIDPEAIRILCRATRIMCEGEMFQIEKREEILTEKDYFHIIEAKTAALFSATAALGGILGNLPKERQAALEKFGLNVGMAFQITDDLLDYTASDSQLGKTSGNDLERGKQTLPLVRTFEVASDSDREELLHQLQNGRRMDRVLPLIEKYGGLEYSNQCARDFADKADQLIPVLDFDSYSDIFRTVCRLVVERSR